VIHPFCELELFELIGDVDQAPHGASWLIRAGRIVRVRPAADLATHPTEMSAQATAYSKSLSTISFVRGARGLTSTVTRAKSCLCWQCLKWTLTIRTGMRTIISRTRDDGVLGCGREAATSLALERIHFICKIVQQLMLFGLADRATC
jgi:hypothetical protein